MNKSTKKILIIATLALIAFQSSFFTVDQRQQVLILQFGEPIRVIETPGIKFKMPFIQNAIFFEKRKIVNIKVKQFFSYFFIIKILNVSFYTIILH